MKRYCDKSKAAKLQEAEEMTTMVGDRFPRASFGKLIQTLSKYAPKENKASKKKVKKSTAGTNTSSNITVADPGPHQNSMDATLTLPCSTSTDTYDNREDIIHAMIHAPTTMTTTTATTSYILPMRHYYQQ
jgi:hypothetical protein